MRALSLCTCCRHYPGTATGGTAVLIRPVMSAFPGMAAGSACASTFSRLAQRSLTLRPAHSRCHQFVARLSEGFNHFVTSIVAPVASGWSGCRAGLAPAGKRRLFTAHAIKSRSWPAASRQANDGRGQPRAAGDREDPHPPRVGSAATTPRAGARGGAGLKQAAWAAPAVPDTRHINTGCATKPQPVWRCATCPPNAASLRVNPADSTQTTPRERSPAC